MTIRTSFIALALFAFATGAAAQEKKAEAAAPATAATTAVATTKPLPEAAKLAPRLATGTAADDKSSQPAQTQSLRANKKKSGGGQTEDDLYVGVK
ncbi:MAG: hypothetical protein QM599_05420 [Pseudoxanthomonas sp.]